MTREKRVAREGGLSPFKSSCQKFKTEKEHKNLKKKSSLVFHA